ncbi:MAG: hypothetical protein KTR21_13250 [Rhodobacteraceae bacterium]|nr:hypothetical protein [Paracoccaceae bacterium]
MQLNLVVGVIFIGLGLLTLAGRIFSWNSLFARRTRMKKIFGDTLGDAIHFGAYTMVPILAGVNLLLGVFEL